MGFLPFPSQSETTSVEEIPGLEAWDAEEVYPEGWNVKEDGRIWESILDNNEGNQPSLDDPESPQYWKEVSSSHVHNNKSVLDSISQGLVNAWNAAYAWIDAHLQDLYAHIQPGEREPWNDAAEKAHDQNTDTGTNQADFSIGSGTTTGTTRTIRAGGSPANIDFLLSPKGTGYFKLGGLRYEITDEKILVIEPTTGRILAQYLVADEFVATPPTLTSPGIPGQKAWDGNYLYYCVAMNVWIQVFALSANLQFADLFVAVPPTPNYPGKQGQRAYDADNQMMYDCITDNPNGTLVAWTRHTVTNSW